MKNGPKVPDELADLLTTNVFGHVSCLNVRVRILTNIMWIDYDGEHIVISSPCGLNDPPISRDSSVPPEDHSSQSARMLLGRQ